MNKKTFLSILLALSLAAVSVFAQEEGGGLKFSTLLLTIAILLGLGSSLFVFFMGYRMKGGVVGSALLFYASGMLAVVVSLLSVTWLKTTFGGVAGTLHDLFFIIGFLLMIAGTKKIEKVSA